MTTKEELKLLLMRHRWAFEELAYDQKTQEANALASGPARSMFDYLHECYGSNAAVLGALKSIVTHQGDRRKTLHLRKGR